MKSNIFITGFSGSGKTTVGKEVSRRLGWRFVDMDEEIVSAAGKSIEAIFAEDGEPRFRDLEHQCLARIAQGERQVVSTGGGIITQERNRRVMEDNGVIICLEARPETVHQRLTREQAQASSPVVRPMLVSDDPLARIQSLKAQRQASYALAHWTVHTDHLSPAEAAEEVIRGFRLISARAQAAAGSQDGDLAATVRTSSGDYPIWVGWSLLDELGERTRRVLSPRAAYVITDEGVYRHARAAQVSLEAAGIPTHMFIIPPGEQSKTLETAQHIYKWLAERRAERGHLVLAVGGGVVGDLAGFVAATFVRGMPFAQVPTSLLAMMDAAIGGKVAVDLPAGKNLVGAFYQPRFVLADVKTLLTLPQRELRSGWAEAIKHSLILDRELLSLFEGQLESVLNLEEETATRIIRRSVAIKANVVSRDEKETLGIRVLLNYGHTVGHALEAATGYGAFLHGEAVSVGMMAAAHISREMGMLTDAEVQRQRRLLEAFGLPVSCHGVDMDAVSRAMLMDKKTSGRAIQWVLLDGIGRAVTRRDVPPEAVQHALRCISTSDCCCSSR